MKIQGTLSEDQQAFSSSEALLFKERWFAEKKQEILTHPGDKNTVFPEIKVIILLGFAEKKHSKAEERKPEILQTSLFFFSFCAQKYFLPTLLRAKDPTHLLAQVCSSAQQVWCAACLGGQGLQMGTIPSGGKGCSTSYHGEGRALRLSQFLFFFYQFTFFFAWRSKSS